jgi:DNA topoisomerase-1
LRAGNEKNTDEAADTVGCCSLRVEHIKLHPPNKVEFDFLGKDSMRYNNTVEVDKLGYENFGKFIAKPKKPTDDVFDCLTTSTLNKYLSTLMPGLTAKVFRTFNASFCMQRELEKWDAKKNKNATSEEKLVFFNATSVQVAILCNHQRTVSKTHDAQMGKIDDQIAEDEGYVKDLKGWAKQFKKGVTPEKKEDKKKPKKKKGDESSEEEEVDKRPIPKSEEACLKKIESLENRIKKAKLKKQDKDNLKEVSTSTSKVNYIDPRITIAWCKKVDLDTSRVFTKTLREKFGWAYRAVEEDEEFAF